MPPHRDGGRVFKGEHQDYSLVGNVQLGQELPLSPSYRKPASLPTTMATQETGPSAYSEKQVYRTQIKLLIISQKLHNLGEATRGWIF